MCLHGHVNTKMYVCSHTQNHTFFFAAVSLSFDSSPFWLFRPAKPARSALFFSLCMCVCVCVCVCVCENVCIHICCMHLHMTKLQCVHICMNTCMHAYIYTHRRTFPQVSQLAGAKKEGRGGKRETYNAAPFHKHRGLHGQVRRTRTWTIISHICCICYLIFLQHWRGGMYRGDTRRHRRPQRFLRLHLEQ